MGLILIVDNKGVGSRSLPRMVQDHRARVLVKSPPFNYADLDHSGIIISGGSLDWARHLEILGWYKQLITTADVPILGICLGHRIIGVTQGARTRRMPVPENGDVEITFNKDYPLLPGTRKAIVKEQHQYELLTLPEDMISYASSNLCGIQAIKHSAKLIFGIQFHIELGGKVGARILTSFLRICDEPRLQDKIIS